MVTASDLVTRLLESRHGFGVAEGLQGLFQSGEVLVPDQHGSRTTVAGEHDALVFALGAVDEIGQMVTHGPQRLHAYGHNVAPFLGEDDGDD